MLEDDIRTQSDPPHHSWQLASSHFSPSFLHHKQMFGLGERGHVGTLKHKESTAGGGRGRGKRTWEKK